MPMKAEKFNHRIDIEQRQRSQDSTSGDTTESWVPVWQSVPASIEYLSVRDFIASRAAQSEIVARITIRYREGLDASMRIVHNGKIYNPQGWLPDNDSGREYLTAPCSEGVNDGQ